MLRAVCRSAGAEIEFVDGTPANDGSGVYERVACPQCHGTGGGFTGAPCSLCKGSRMVSEMVLDQMRRMSAS